MFINFSEYLVLKWKTQSSLWDCFKVAHVFTLRTAFQLLKKKLRATLFWDGPLRIQGNWPGWPLSTEVNF